MSGTKFTRLDIEGWRQFDQIHVDFHPRLTILTGANGAGKSTLLSILSRHFGYHRQFLATPVSSGGVTKYFVGHLIAGSRKRKSATSRSASERLSIQMGAPVFCSCRADRVALDVPEDLFYWSGCFFFGQGAPNGRAKFTEDLLGLNRAEVLERRREALISLRNATLIIEGAHPTVKAALIRDFLERELSDEREYAGMARAFVRAKGEVTT